MLLGNSACTVYAAIHLCCMLLWNVALSVGRSQSTAASSRPGRPPVERFLSCSLSLGFIFGTIHSTTSARTQPLRSNASKQTQPDTPRQRTRRGPHQLIAPDICGSLPPKGPSAAPHRRPSECRAPSRRTNTPRRPVSTTTRCVRDRCAKGGTP